MYEGKEPEGMLGKKEIHYLSLSKRCYIIYTSVKKGEHYFHLSVLKLIEFKNQRENSGRHLR
jgi:hypothetical protein